MRLATASLVLAAPAMANATWYQASSKHFVIYADQKPEDLYEFAEKLEQFDQAVRKVRRMADPPVGDGNRLTVFVVNGVEAVQKLHRGHDSSVYGFYVPRYVGPLAFVPRRAQEGRGGLSSDSVFFHEYAHHLMFQQFNEAFPNWYVEGFAELFGTPKFNDDGSVTLGTAPLHRAYGLFSSEGLTTQQVLEAQPARMDAAERESIYGRGWLLTHYLTFEPSRRGQLARYIGLLTKGQPMGQAATDAFGDLKQLDRELYGYVRRRKLTAVTVDGHSLSIGRIDVTPLAAGAAEVIQWRMTSKRGVDQAIAQKVVVKVRQIAARYPADALVQASLAEAEYDVHDYKAALAAADAALRADPRLVEALTYRGRALVELAKTRDAAGSYVKARQAYLAANKIDTEDPEPLFLYFESFLEEGKEPTKNAIAALHYASVLAPQDDGVRFYSATAFLQDGQLAEARMELLPIAFNPHGGEGAEVARGAIAKIDAKDGKAAIALITRDPAS